MCRSRSDAANMVLGLSFRAAHSRALCTSDVVASLASRAGACFEDPARESGVHETEYSTLLAAVVNFTSAAENQVRLCAVRMGLAGA